MGARRVVLLATGGTIAGAGLAVSGAAGHRAWSYRAGALPPEQLLRQVPGLEQLARLRHETLFQVDSADFTDTMLLQLARRVAALCRDDEVDGVVVTHGTDTLEESAYFLHLTVPSSKPVVFTGAMHPATALSADGPANLRDAVAVAAHRDSADRGVLAVLDGRIHSARDLTKRASTGAAAFSSPHGPLGRVLQAVPRWYRRPERPHTRASQFSIDRIAALPLVGLVSSHGNMRAEIYQTWVRLGARAIVHAGFGSGTVPDYLLPALSALRAQGVLLVRASRTADGLLARNGTADDDAHGWVVVDDQNPPRARLLAALALAQDAGIAPAQLQQLFDRY